jgi:hypothetical protein
MVFMPTLQYLQNVDLLSAMPLPENVFDGHRTLAAAGGGVGEQVGQPQPQRVLGLCVPSDSEFPERAAQFSVKFCYI